MTLHDSPVRDGALRARPVARRTAFTAFIAAALGALLALMIVWLVGPTSRVGGPDVVVDAGFSTHTITIIDQLGTVHVDVWVKNHERFAVSATCAVIVRSGTGHPHHHYQGSAAFALRSIGPQQTKRFIEVVTGVYYDGDATGPIGSMLLPLPQYARLSAGSTVQCVSARAK